MYRSLSLCFRTTNLRDLEARRILFVASFFFFFLGRMTKKILQKISDANVATLLRFLSNLINYDHRFILSVKERIEFR